MERRLASRSIEARIRCSKWQQRCPRPARHCKPRPPTEPRGCAGGREVLLRRASRSRSSHSGADTLDRRGCRRLAVVLQGRLPPHPHFGVPGRCREVVRRRGRRVVIEHRDGPDDRSSHVQGASGFSVRVASARARGGGPHRGLGEVGLRRSPAQRSCAAPSRRGPKGTASPAPVAVPVHGIMAGARTRSAGLTEQARGVCQGADATMRRLPRNSLCSRAAPHLSRPLRAGRSGDSTRPTGSDGSSADSERIAGQPDSRALGPLLIPRIPWGNHTGSCRTLSRYCCRWPENSPDVCFPGPGRKKTRPMESPTSGEPYARIARPFHAATTYREPRKGKRPSGGGWNRSRAVGCAASLHRRA